MTDTSDTSDTRTRIRTLAAEYPYASIAEIARVVGISRQRAAQIVAEEGIRVGRPTIDRRGRQHTSQRIKLPSAPEPLERTGGVDLPLSPAVRGTVGELLVAADLTARGYVVFFPLVRTAACDLVSLAPDGGLERIEVRRGKIGIDGKTVNWAAPDKSKSDRRAIVVVGHSVRYEPPLPTEGGSHG